MTSNTQPLTWKSPLDALTISPRDGGRVVSWVHRGEERVLAPAIFEGGLFRVLFAEEQYPGSSYTSPHQVMAWSSDEDGFSLWLRHFWSAPNAFMRAAGWSGKASELHIDGLLLDKRLRFDAAGSSLSCEVTIGNDTDDAKCVTPWIHNAMSAWPAQQWMAADGKREAYRDVDVYWGSHLAGDAGRLAMVHANESGSSFSVLQAAAQPLKGMAGYTPIPGEFHQSTCELRYLPIDLAPGRQWRATSVLTMTDDWQTVVDRPPVELVAEESDVDVMGAANADAGGLCPTSLLESWMLPTERDVGWMVLSFLDKPPFSSAARFHAAHSFAGFHVECHADGDVDSHDASAKASATVAIFAADAMPLRAELAGDERWTIAEQGGASTDPTAAVELALSPAALTLLTLTGPEKLAGRDDVSVRLIDAAGRAVTLTIDAAATVELRYPYQIRQGPAYLRQRYRDRLGPVAGASADEVLAWQAAMRQRIRRWLDFHRNGDCAMEPRLVERQVGPTCVREKWLVQTEPGLWAPGYLIHPIGASGRLPLLYQLHGSGSGKDGFAPDEQVNPTRTQLGHELEYMPYELATTLNCRVYVPDGRGQGELGETNPGIWPARINAMDVSNTALRVWDQIRSLDWLLTRDDIDADRVGSLGCSGGGGMTYWFAAADERIAASIVSSTSSATPVDVVEPSYFDRMFADASVRLFSDERAPISGAPMGMLVAPRPMWIIDGMDDLLTPSDERKAWRAELQRGRDQIRGTYQSLNAEDKYADEWFDAGHCGGMSVANVAAWFRKWF